MAPKSVKPNGQGASAPNKPAPKKAASKKAKKAASGKKKGASRNYIRNLHSGAGGARLTLTNDVELRLAPRGQVGDLLLVSEEHRQDPRYQQNIDFLFEELTIEEGLEVIDKQNTNAQAYRSSPMDYITNELGERYQQPAVITPTHEAQGQIVGQVTPSIEGQRPQAGGNIQRETQSAISQMGQGQPAISQVMGPPQINVPGSQFNPDVLPAGLTTKQAEVFLQTPPEQRFALIEQWANEATESYVDNLRAAR